MLTKEQAAEILRAAIESSIAASDARPWNGSKSHDREWHERPVYRAGIHCGAQALFEDLVKAGAFGE